MGHMQERGTGCEGVWNWKILFVLFVIHWAFLWSMNWLVSGKTLYCNEHMVENRSGCASFIVCLAIFQGWFHSTSQHYIKYVNVYKTCGSNYRVLRNSWIILGRLCVPRIHILNVFRIHIRNIGQIPGNDDANQWSHITFVRVGSACCHCSTAWT